MPQPRGTVTTAPSLEVGCPYCGEPQPSPESGSHIWTPDELKQKAGERRECVSCDKEIIINAPKNAQVVY